MKKHAWDRSDIPSVCISKIQPIYFSVCPWKTHWNLGIHGKTQSFSHRCCPSVNHQSAGRWWMIAPPSRRWRLLVGSCAISCNWGKDSGICSICPIDHKACSVVPKALIHINTSNKNRQVFILRECHDDSDTQLQPLSHKISLLWSFFLGVWLVKKLLRITMRPKRRKLKPFLRTWTPSHIPLTARSSYIHLDASSFSPSSLLLYPLQQTSIHTHTITHARICNPP